MSLGDFYKTAYSRGFSRDFQLRVSEIIVGGDALSSSRLASEALNYVKTASIPSRKTEVPTVSYNTVKLPVSTGISDFGNKDNYQITFWADQGLDFRSWFFNRIEQVKIPLYSNKFPPTLTENIIQLEVLNDMLQPVLGYTLQGVCIKEVSEIKYNKEGSGKPQEFTVTFAFYTVTPTQGLGFGPTVIGAPEEKAPGGFIGALQTITGIANTISNTAQAVRGVATATRSAGRAIRGR